MTEIVSTQGLYTTNEIEDYLRCNSFEIKFCSGKNLKTIFELGQYYQQIETGWKQMLRIFNSMGIELTDAIITGIVP